MGSAYVPTFFVGMYAPPREKGSLMSQLKVGWAEFDTTPEGTVDLCGQYYHRVSQGIHSRLSATALALESADREQAVMVSLDLVGFESTFQDELRAHASPRLAGSGCFQSYS